MYGMLTAAMLHRHADRPMQPNTIPCLLCRPVDWEPKHCNVCKVCSASNLYMPQTCAMEPNSRVDKMSHSLNPCVAHHHRARSDASRRLLCYANPACLQQWQHQLRGWLSGGFEPAECLLSSAPAIRLWQRSLLGELPTCLRPRQQQHALKCSSDDGQPERSEPAVQAPACLKHAVHACSNDNAGSNDDTVASLAILSNPQLSGDSVTFPLVSSLPSDNRPSSAASYYQTNAAVSHCSTLLKHCQAVFSLPGHTGLCQQPHAQHSSLQAGLMLQTSAITLLPGTRQLRMHPFHMEECRVPMFTLRASLQK